MLIFIKLINIVSLFHLFDIITLVNVTGYSFMLTEVEYRFNCFLVMTDVLEILNVI